MFWIEIKLHLHPLLLPSLPTLPMSSTLKVSFSLIICVIYLNVYMYMHRYMDSICWIQCNMISPETIYTPITKLLILKSQALALDSSSSLSWHSLFSLFLSLSTIPLFSWPSSVYWLHSVSCFLSRCWTLPDTLAALPLISTMKTSSTIKKNKTRKEKNQSRRCVLGEMERW